jgi:hypothetical protein
MAGSGEVDESAGEDDLLNGRFPPAVFFITSASALIRSTHAIQPHMQETGAANIRSPKGTVCSPS